jgi:Lon protease-like protein
MNQPADARPLPIFALGTVLFPQGVLPLRVFETRYVDMVRGCLREERCFGVCLITAGNEVGEPAEHEAIGCFARIRAWDMEQPGVLQIWAHGEGRFRVLERETRPDGLVVAEVDPIPDDLDEPLPDEFDDCRRLLHRIVADIVEREADPLRRLVAEPYRFDSLVWVSNRLAEFLPLPGHGKQSLMRADSALARIVVIRDFLRRHGVL